MASYIQGYDEERFVTTISRNFLCLICFNVLKDPVLCPRNQHCFCRGCITKHLENSRRCPTCADELTEEALTEPPRMVKNYLNESKIRCVYHDRGCLETLQLQHLDQHEDSCGFTPAVCTNPGCGATLNKRDLTIHESELCEYRKLKCHSCGEMTETLADMEKRMARVETNQANVEKSMETKFSNLEKNMETKFSNLEKHIKKKISNLEKNMETKLTNLEKNMETKRTNLEKSMETKLTNLEKNMETKLTNLEKNMETRFANFEKNTADTEGKLEVVNNEVKGLKTALVEGFNQLKDVLVNMEGNVKENSGEVRSALSGDRENILVAGGRGNDSVEMFNWRQKTWSQLQSMPKKRWGATSFVHNNQVVIAGGYCAGSGPVDDMIRMNVHPHPKLSTHWSECPVKLPAKMTNHSSVLYDDKLMVTGGVDRNATSDKIHEVQVVPPYTVKTLSRMPEPRQYHCMEIFDDSLLILGGRTTHDCKDNLSSVVLYHMKNNVCKQLAPLPYEVSDMATVRWGDNVVVIGGIDKRGKPLNTVIMYNVKTGQSHMLPPMRCKRAGCTAVVVGNNIVVLGGYSEQGYLKSVECFNFEHNTWQELPEMSQTRYYHAVVVV